MTVVASGYAEQPNHLYETDYWATQALINRFPVVGMIVWEPAAGNHKLADMLRVNGATVITSDIATYNRQHDFCPVDFLAGHVSPPLIYFDAIITNPPFGPRGKLAADFCRRALELCPGTVAMLCTAKFDAGSTRTDLFRDNPRFCAKITLLDRIRWFDGPDSEDGTEDHAWYVWNTADSGFNNPRIYYERNPAKC